LAVQGPFNRIPRYPEEHTAIVYSGGKTLKAVDKAAEAAMNGQAS